MNRDAQGVPGVLQRVGALNCLANRFEGADAATATRLQCELRLERPDADPIRYEGEIVGSGLYLVDPGNVRLLWSVLAPTQTLRVDALAGDYDIASQHNFALAENEGKNVLFGGVGGSVALQLVAPSVASISPSTRLTLQRL